MCGRFALIAEPALIQTQFHLTTVPETAPRYNIAPTQPSPVIVNEEPRELSVFQWGLIPSWAKDDSLGGKMINARSETVEDKPAFRAAFKRRRCIVPASGFYEWQQHEGAKTKTPFYIYPNDGELFALAGLWEVWNTPDGSSLPTFTILTTEANTFMQQYHERMPVMLRPEDYDAWLQPGEVPADVLRPLLKPYDPERMTAHEVSRLVNKPGNDSPELIARAQAPML